MELAFIAACRNGKAKGLKGKTGRAEYIDLIVRLALAAFKPKKKEKTAGQKNEKGGDVWENSPSEAVQQYLDQFLVPVFEEQTLIQERKYIRDRVQLNKALFENRHGLRWIYEAHKARLPDPYQQSLGFGITQATSLFRNIFPVLGADPASPDTQQLIQECFLFS